MKKKKKKEINRQLRRKERRLKQSYEHKLQNELSDLYVMLYGLKYECCKKEGDIITIRQMWKLEIEKSKFWRNRFILMAFTSILSSSLLIIIN